MAKRATPICPARHEGSAAMQAKWTAAPYSLTLDELLARTPSTAFCITTSSMWGPYGWKPPQRAPVTLSYPVGQPRLAGSSGPPWSRLLLQFLHQTPSSPSPRRPLAPCAPWPSLLAPGRWTAWRERGMGCNWHTSPRKEGHSMTDRLQEHWSGVLLTAFMVGLLLGSVLVLRLTGH